MLHLLTRTPHASSPLAHYALDSRMQTLASEHPLLPLCRKKLFIQMWQGWLPHALHCPLRTWAQKALLSAPPYIFYLTQDCVSHIAK